MEFLQTVLLVRMPSPAPCTDVRNGTCSPLTTFVQRFSARPQPSASFHRKRIPHKYIDFNKLRLSIKLPSERPQSAQRTTLLKAITAGQATMIVAEDTHNTLMSLRLPVTEFA